MNILIIDSKKGHGRKLKLLLENAIEGCIANVKCTALEALAELRNPDYDLLIIGNDLPEAPADDFMAMVKDTGRKIPSLIISNDNDEYFPGDNEPIDSSSYIIAADSVSQMLPLLVDEIHKRYLLYQENLALKAEFKKSQTNYKIVDIALNCNHKINNPLMTILGNTQLLIRDCASCDSKTIARLEKIEKAAKRIQEITLGLANSLGSPSEPQEMLKSSK
jgi:DNA-binding NarL/FixJ family response regulator